MHSFAEQNNLESFSSEIKSLSSIDDNITIGQNRVELTLSHPRTAPFKRMTESEQKSLYCSMLQTALDKVKLIKDSSNFFEKSSDGNLHMHATLYISDSEPFIVYGLVADVCRALFSKLPKRYSSYRPHDYNAHFCRYTSPMMCVQYRRFDEVERASAWDSYIRKSQA